MVPPSYFRHGIALVLLVLLCAAWSIEINAASNETPPALSGVIVVDSRTVAAMQVRDDASLIDTRSLHDFLVGHLPNAHHVDYLERSARVPNFDPAQDDTAAFISRLKKFAQPDHPIILYCNGVACWKSYKAAIAAKENGYLHIYWFRGGIYDWQKAGNPIIVEFME
jgi:rhodanese-related sulfurtransferase